MPWGSREWAEVTGALPRSLTEWAAVFLGPCLCWVVRGWRPSSRMVAHPLLSTLWPCKSPQALRT